MWLRSCALLALLSAAVGTQAQSANSARSAEDAALDLIPGATQASPGPKPASARSPVKAYAEQAVGRLDQRYESSADTYRRASFDLLGDWKPASGWRAVFSSRVDDVHPVEPGERTTLFSLREAFVAWQSGDAGWGLDLGRLNVRHGPAYGFNPTDYFRTGASRAVTTADPLALRENRLGTAMLRAQRLWSGGGVSLALAPKLRDTASRESFSADLGATNHSHRALLALSVQASDRVSGQVFGFHERGVGSQMGVNATALLGDSTVAFVEASHGRGRDLFNALLGTEPRVRTATQAAGGVTFTLPSRLALTAELQLNGFAVSESRWQSAVDQFGLEPMAAYLVAAQARQDIASRRAALVYVTQSDAGLKNLDLTALARYNIDDRSRFFWAEARYHFPRLDLALQWQTNQGAAITEYGAAPGKTLVQLLVAAYF